MGRTMSKHLKNTTSYFDNFRKGKKNKARKKTRNISKWGKHNSNEFDTEVDTFELRSPRYLHGELEGEHEVGGWE